MGLLERLSAHTRRLLASRAEHGPYRFLVRRWDQISDIDLAVRVLDTEFFRPEIVPLELPVQGLRSILVLAPHQDDETIGAGGALLLASRAGVRIDVVYVTNGDIEAPAYAASSKEAVDIRNAEAREVCERLGATMHHLDLSNVRPEPTPAHLDRLAQIVREVNPDVVMAPWLLDAPAKHRLVNHLLWLANRRAVLPECEVWGYQAHNTLFSNGYVDITPVAEEKRALLECFKSQNLHSTRYDHLVMGLAAWNARILNSTEPRYLELFFALPMKELLRLVERFYFTDLRTTYRSHAAVLPGMTELHRTVTGTTRASGDR
jgi:N-acetylglucosamine malate deacetylase 1